MECLGSSTRRHRDCFDENHAEIIDLIGKKRAAHLAHLHDPLCTTKEDALWSICSIVQLKLREMQNSWLSARADKIQGYADKNDMKKLLKRSEGGLRSHQCRLISTSEWKWNQAHIREEQDPEEVGWAFRWCIQQAIFYQWQDHWTTVTSPMNESLDVTLALEEVQIAIH